MNITIDHNGENPIRLVAERPAAPELLCRTRCVRHAVLDFSEVDETKVDLPQHLLKRKTNGRTSIPAASDISADGVNERWKMHTGSVCRQPFQLPAAMH
jgi:hypothetical protein